VPSAVAKRNDVSRSRPFETFQRHDHAAAAALAQLRPQRFNSACEISPLVAGPIICCASAERHPLQRPPPMCPETGHRGALTSCGRDFRGDDPLLRKVTNTAAPTSAE